MRCSGLVGLMRRVSPASNVLRVSTGPRRHHAPVSGGGEGSKRPEEGRLCIRPKPGRLAAQGMVNQSINRWLCLAPQAVSLLLLLPLPLPLPLLLILKTISLNPTQRGKLAKEFSTPLLSARHTTPHMMMLMMMMMLHASVISMVSFAHSTLMDRVRFGWAL